MHDVLSLILGGGQGSRLYPLTKLRAKPAMPVAGKYRLIDIPISNCINSELKRIYVLTQFLSVSLHRHIAHTYKFDQFSSSFVEILAAQQTNEGAVWYQGTADAVRQHVRYVQEDHCRQVLILSGDQLYRMDFRQLVKTHRETQADVTIAVLPVQARQASAFGILGLDDNGQVKTFVEKPATEEALTPLKVSAAWIEARGIPCQGRHYLASMGIYLFERQVLLDLLDTRPLAADFGKEIFPRSIHTHRVQAHLFDGYWEDLGTVQSYHEASLALCGDQPAFDFHSPEGVIYTRMRFLPAARVSDAQVRHCVLSDGCVVLPGAKIDQCILGIRSRIGRNCLLKDSIIIGADRFETDDDRAANRQSGVPNFTVGDDTIIDRAIIDKDARIGNRVKIVNQRSVPNEEGPNYVIRDGIVVIPKAAVVPDGTVI